MIYPSADRPSFNDDKRSMKMRDIFPYTAFISAAISSFAASSNDLMIAIILLPRKNYYHYYEVSRQSRVCLKYVRWVIDSWCYYDVLTFKCAHINQSKYEFIARQLTHSSSRFSHTRALLLFLLPHPPTNKLFIRIHYLELFNILTTCLNLKITDRYFLKFEYFCRLF